MTVREKAVCLHERGFNCAQAVLCSSAALCALDEETALAVSGGFGGGCRCGEICGAISGAIMAAGLCCRYTDEHDVETKERIAALSRSLSGAFRERFGALRCEEIKTDREQCNRYIAYMAELTEKTLEEIQS